ncbi:TatD family hydrolase [Anatilimnocola floriformis]|uniref:TatD family hydrolase n=1 Tax=Anatilimnocola floriformis TaxID=2948575 RepID=UPI0020C4E200|nr:TatD family hydrolase [Anatilimnocola floriformis]
MELYDTHAHLFDDQLAADVAGVIERARLARVTRILAVGTTADSSAACQQTAVQFPNVVRSSAGIHPNHAGEAQPGDWDRIVELAKLPEVIALGETGLDLYWKDCPLPLQQDYFDRHIRLSQQTGLPLVIHQRETTQEILAMLREARQRGELRGVMHSYTGTADEVKEFIALGLHISFAGMLTFKKSDDLRAVAKTIPAERLLVETDSPYLTPHPFRGQRPNEPRLVVHTAECLAEVRSLSLGELAALTTANAQRLFTRR